MADEHAPHAEHGDEHKGHSGGHGGGHHGGGGHAEGEHEGAPEWLISFADNVALMMGFFVILLAMNMGPKATPKQGGEPSDVAAFEEARQLDFVIAIREAFNSAPDEGNPGDVKLVRRMKERKALGETARPGPDGDKHNLQAPRPTNWTAPTGVVFFDEQDTALSEDARTALRAAADMLRGSRWIVQVRGHVSGAEARSDKARAMRLSFERALAAAQELVNQGLSWDQLRVVGCADADAATPAAGTPGARRDNQRAEVVTTQEAVPADQWNERKK
jgi:flagellar motor protein MotB